MSDEEIFRQPFDIARHKTHFQNYLEIIILPDGTAEYAIPSHQEKLISIACLQKNISRDELNDMCPKEFYCDFLTWLCMITDCVSVWNDFFFGTPNPSQRTMLQTLKNHGVYHGEVEKRTTLR
jgi:hypothetical protein